MTRASNTDLLGDLILGLSKRLRLLYPFTRANGPMEVDVVDAARVIGLALYSKILGPSVDVKDPLSLCGIPRFRRAQSGPLHRVVKKGSGGIRFGSGIR